MIVKIFLYLISAAVIITGADNNTTLNRLNDNECKDLGLYGGTACSQRTGYENCGNISDYSGFVYDSDRHQLLMFGGGHSATGRTDVDGFSFSTLLWTSQYSTMSCIEQTQANLDPAGHFISTGHPMANHTYDNLVYCPNVKKMVLLNNFHAKSATQINGCFTSPLDFGTNTKAHVYDPDTKKWSVSKANALGKSWGASEYGAGEFDTISGLMLYISQTSLWTYDPVNDTLIDRKVRIPSGFGTSGQLVYSGINDRFYYFCGYWVDTFQVYEITPNRSDWSKTTIVKIDNMGNGWPMASKTSDSGEVGFAYDNVNNVIGGGILNNTFFAFSPITKSWNKVTMTGSKADRLNYHCIAYDPIDNAYLFLSGPWNNRRMYGYRYKRADVSSESSNSYSSAGLFMDIKPNPFNPSCAISFCMADKGSYKIDIYDTRGNIVKILTGRSQFSGIQNQVWDGKNRLGKDCATGSYLFRVSTGTKYSYKKGFLLR